MASTHQTAVEVSLDAPPPESAAPESPAASSLGGGSSVGSSPAGSDGRSMGVPVREAMLETASPTCPLHPATNASKSKREPSRHVLLMFEPEIVRAS